MYGRRKKNVLPPPGVSATRIVPPKERGDLAGDGQPKAEMVFDAAGLVGTVEAPEYFLLFLVGDADAIVGNRQNKAFRLSGSIQRKG